MACHSGSHLIAHAEWRHVSPQKVTEYIGIYTAGKINANAHEECIHCLVLFHCSLFSMLFFSHAFACQMSHVTAMKGGREGRVGERTSRGHGGR